MKRQMVLIASLVAALAAALLTRMYISAKESELAAVRDRFRAEYGEMQALAFAQDVASGSVISDVDLVIVKTYRKGNEGSVIAPENKLDIVGKRTIGFHPRNEPLRWNDVEGGDPRTLGLASKVTAKQRAMSININAQTSVGGAVRPGDTVDVIGTFDFPDDEGKIRRGDPVTCTVLQRVVVLAKSGATVTLAVTPREAEMLAFAEHIKGRLTLTLRNKDDTSTEDELPIVDFSRIRDQIETLNKQRNRSGGRGPRMR